MITIINNDNSGQDLAVVAEHGEILNIFQPAAAADDEIPRQVIQYNYCHLPAYSVA